MPVKKLSEIYQKEMLYVNTLGWPYYKDTPTTQAQLSLHSVSTFLSNPLTILCK